METAASKRVKLENEEQEILNELFFVSSFENILGSTSLGQTYTEKTLKKLVENKLVKQMAFDNNIRDYIETKSLEDIRSCAYVITKKGLSSHIYG